MKYSEFKKLKQEEERKLDSLKIYISEIRYKKMDEVIDYLKRVHQYDVEYHTAYELARYFAERFDMQVFETSVYHVA